MDRWMLVTLGIALVICAAILIFAPAAQAGPPLLCYPFQIDDAKSLPWGSGGWRAPAPDYDLRRLADDTLSLLGPDVPVIVRMETLRRAAVYATKDRQIAAHLLGRLEARMHHAEAAGKPDALAVFDAGYLIETYKQAGLAGALGSATGTLDGYAMIRKAIGVRGHDPEMEFAAALALADSRSQDARTAHLRKALAGAEPGSRLAKNLITHCHLVGMRATTLAEMRSQLGSPKI